MDFCKLIDKNVGKKTFQNKHLYIRVTDILKFYEVFFCLAFKKQSLSLHSSYMHKTLPTLGDEKEQ